MPVVQIPARYLPALLETGEPPEHGIFQAAGCGKSDGTRGRVPEAKRGGKRSTTRYHVCRYAAVILYPKIILAKKYTRFVFSRKLRSHLWARRQDLEPEWNSDFARERPGQPDQGHRGLWLGRGEDADGQAHGGG